MKRLSPSPSASKSSRRLIFGTLASPHIDRPEEHSCEADGTRRDDSTSGFMYFVAEVIQREAISPCSLEADESNLYVGTTDGFLLHYVIHKLDPDSDSLEFTYLLASKQTTHDQVPAKQILLLPIVNLAAILVNESLSFFSLPEFAPASDVRTIKDVQGVLQNSSAESRVESDGSISLTVFTKKKVRQVKVSNSAVRLVKEVEYLNCRAACQQGNIVCVATSSSYDLVDLDQRAKIQLFPVVQGEMDPVGPRFERYRPLIISTTPTEFLLVSGSPESSTAMGMFITLEGEITRGTLMFESYPLAIESSYPLVIALLEDGKVEIHDITTQGKLQTMEIPGVTGLSLTNGIVDAVLKSQLQKMIFCHLESGAGEKEDLADLDLARRLSIAKSNILLHSSDQILVLLRETHFLRVEAVLDAGDPQTALSMITQIDRNLSAEENLRLYHESAYLHQKAGLLYFSKMLFDDAMDCFTKGKVDPRALISLFPEFNVEGSGGKVYAGIKTALDTTASVEEVILDNLRQNVDDEATLVELQGILKANAIELLRRYLTTFRRNRNSGNMLDDEYQLHGLVEKILLQILLDMDKGESKAKLKEFLEESMEGTRAIVDMLKTYKRWTQLAIFLGRTKQYRDALEIWKKLSIGSYEDEDYSNNGVARIKKILLKSGTNEEIWEYGLWLLEYDERTGIEILSCAIDDKMVNFTRADVLDELRKDASRGASFQRFLEDTVLVRGDTDFNLSNELIRLQIGKVLTLLQEATVKSAMTSLIESYRALSLPKMPYVSYIANLPRENDDGLISQFNSEKSKMLDLLQSQVNYDAQEMLNLVLQQKPLLLAARILLYGRLSQHEESLNILVHDLKDFDSAEVYCYHGGISLSQIRIASNKSETVEMRKVLFLQLFAEYLKLDDYTLQFTRGSELLNRWGNYLDIEAILKMLPNNWSIELVSAFLTSGLAQLSSRKREAIIRQSLVRANLLNEQKKRFMRVN